MVIQADAVPLEQTLAAPMLAIVVALGVERACLDHAGVNDRDDTIVLQSGPGPARAAAAARRAIAAGAGAVLSFGLAGGLAPGAAPGTVVLPERILSEDDRNRPVDHEWRSALEARIGAQFPVTGGTLLSTARVLVEPVEKAQAYRVCGAVACDMESAAICDVAAAAQVPVLVLRVVTDTHEDRLPADVAAWVDVAGDNRLFPVLAALAKPGQWRSTFVIASRFATARRSMTRLASSLVPVAFSRQPIAPR